MCFVGNQDEFSEIYEHRTHTVSILHMLFVFELQCFTLSPNISDSHPFNFVVDLAGPIGYLMVGSDYSYQVKAQNRT